MDALSSSGEGQKGASACQSERNRFRLRKRDRIRRSADYRRIMQEGARYRTANFHIRVLKNDAGGVRVGIIASKRAGNACVRNRIKRRLREYFRLNRDKMPPETDVVFIVTPGATQLDTRQLRTELDRFFLRGR
ncbi:MAG: ribonuclease P protein component [Desulfomonilaceae bacterium]